MVLKFCSSIYNRELILFYSDLETYINVSISNELQFKNEKFDTLNKQNRLKAIAQFLDFYKITEEEISADSVYKAMYRKSKTDKC